ncbi:MAG: aminotransferase class V-fold PLP-dependent enzyme, partial [Clostridia bacterium]
LIGSAKRHGHVITTMCEHNSVLRPLHEMQKNGIITLTVLKPDENGDITSEMVKDALRPDTYLVAMNAVSNVTGHAQKITNIGELLSQYNVKFLVDGAQSVGYLPINMARDHINMLSIPSHKGLHGMQGAGALCVNNIELLPIVYGGTGTESEKVYQPTTIPDGYEAGTLPTPAILSMGAGIEWINVAKINELPTILRLCELIISGLRQIPTVTVYSEINQSGIIAFNIGDLDSSLISDSLSSGYDIATRSGLHCAPLMHQALGTTKTGIVRVSVSGSNTANECYTLLNAVNQLKNKLTK